MKKNHQMVLFKAFIFISFIILTDLVVGDLLDHFYFNQKEGVFYRTTYSLDSTTADVLVFGSSHASHNYYPEIFEDSLNLTFYNTGRDGNFILANYAVLLSVLNRYSPKIIIFDFDYLNIFYASRNYTCLNSLLPYIDNKPELKRVTYLKSDFERYKTISKIYRYNSLIFQIIYYNIKFIPKREYETNGFLPLYRQLEENAKRDYVNYNGEIDTNNLNALKDIAILCKDKNIKLIFIQSPRYEISNSLTKIEDYMKNLAIFNKIDLIDLHDDPIFMNNPTLFADQSHLNINGAKIFSNKIIANMRNNDSIYSFNISNSRISYTKH